jgi:hypothetical protein
VRNAYSELSRSMNLANKRGFSYHTEHWMEHKIREEFFYTFVILREGSEFAEPNE